MFNKKCLFLFCIAVLSLDILLLCPSVFAENVTTVKIKDINFYNALKSRTGLEMGCASFNDDQREVSVTRVCQESITNLYIAMRGVRDITGIDVLFPYLTYISAYQNEITDITPLQNLEHLTNAAFSANAISDISPIQDKLLSPDFSLSVYGQMLSYTIQNNKINTPKIFNSFTEGLASIKNCNDDDSDICLATLENASFSEDYREINIIDTSQPAQIILYGYDPIVGSMWKLDLVTIDITVDSTIADDSENDNQPIEKSPATIDKSFIYLLALIASLICTAISIKKAAKR